MKQIKRWLLALLFPLLAVSQVLAEGYVEGTSYLKLAKPQPTASADRIEVVELFWYGCSHCFKLEPYLQDWLATKPDDVEFIRLPAILGPSWELLARAYFTADILGVTNKTHATLFDVIHEKKNKLNSDDKLRAFFIDHGVSAEEFDKTFNSFAVAIKLNNARLMTRRYVITGVPTLIVNGKYSTSASLAGGNPAIIKVVDYLVARERKQAAETAESAVTTASQ